MNSALDEWTRRSAGNDAIAGLTERNRLLRERVEALEAERALARAWKCSAKRWRKAYGRTIQKYAMLAMGEK